MRSVTNKANLADLFVIAVYFLLIPTPIPTIARRTKGNRVVRVEKLVKSFVFNVKIYFMEA